MRLNTPDSATTPPVSRRRMLRWLLGFSVVSTLAMVVTPVVSFLLPPKSTAAGSGGKVPAGTTAEIPPGQGKVVPVGSKPAIIVNTEQGLRAYSAICTHLGCIVTYDDLSGTILCPCHDGRFTPTTGAVASGPPPAALSSIEVIVEGEDIFLVSG